jgi:hypothetical protein
MAIIDKKITFTVQEITDKGETSLLKFTPNYARRCCMEFSW